jgi:hypothetical protein
LATDCRFVAKTRRPRRHHGYKRHAATSGVQRNLTVRNPSSDPPDKRRLLIGRTDGGRALTLVVERTSDPTTWLTLTGWDATARERRLLDKR